MDLNRIKRIERVKTVLRDAKRVELARAMHNRAEVEAELAMFANRQSEIAALLVRSGDQMGRDVQGAMDLIDRARTSIDRAEREKEDCTAAESLAKQALAEAERGLRTVEGLKARVSARATRQVRALEQLMTDESARIREDQL